MNLLVLTPVSLLYQIYQYFYPSCFGLIPSVSRNAQEVRRSALPSPAWSPPLHNIPLCKSPRLLYLSSIRFFPSKVISSYTGINFYSSTIASVFFKEVSFLASTSLYINVPNAAQFASVSWVLALAAVRGNEKVCATLQT